MFTKSELILIANALHAVAPTGGGSPQFHLANKVENLNGLPDTNWRKVGRLQEYAYIELNNHLTENDLTITDLVNGRRREDGVWDQ